MLCVSGGAQLGTSASQNLGEQLLWVQSREQRQSQGTLAIQGSHISIGAPLEHHRTQNCCPSAGTPRCQSKLLAHVEVPGLSCSSPPHPSLPSAPACPDRGEATVLLSLLTPSIHLSSRRRTDDRQDHHFQAVQGEGYSPHLEGMGGVFMTHVSAVLSFASRLLPCVSTPAMREGM